MGAAAGKVAKNSIILYIRMVLTIGIALFTTRIVLKGLGVEDFGIYNLVAGVITMLSFLNAAMTTSTQRYLSFYFGKHDFAMQKKVFINSLLLHLAIGVAIVIILQLLGLVIFNGFLNIPVAKIGVAKKVFTLMSFSVLFSILSVPFTASLNAHENMFWIATVNVVEVILKLVTALLLIKFDNGRLMFYATSIALIGLLSFIQYSVFCFKKYEECTLVGLKSLTDKSFIKELGFFAGWNLFGAACTVARVEALAIVLNIFNGTGINAAYGIAIQVAGQLAFFSAAMLQAINPQIMQSEGAGNRDRMLRLSITASKLGFFLLAIIAVPCLFEMSRILSIWLYKVPDYTVILCQILILSAMANQLTIGLQTAIQATGNIKLYQAVVGTTLLINMPLVYLLLKIGTPVQYVLLCNVFIELIACTLRLLILKRLAQLSIKTFINSVFKREVLPILAAITTAYICVHLGNAPWRFLVTFFMTGCVFLITIYFWGLDKNEKNLIASVKAKFFKN